MVFSHWVVHDSVADNVPELTGDAANAVYATVASFIEELDVAGNIEKLKNSTNDLKNELVNQYTEWAIKERELISEQREDQDMLFAIEDDLKDFQKQLEDKKTIVAVFQKTKNWLKRFLHSMS